jgi:hypothetical protein
VNTKVWIKARELMVEANICMGWGYGDRYVFGDEGKMLSDLVSVGTLHE